VVVVAPFRGVVVEVILSGRVLVVVVGGVQSAIGAF